MIVILLVLLAKPATRPQASVPARMASQASPATDVPQASSRAALLWHRALVSVSALPQTPQLRRLCSWLLPICPGALQIHLLVPSWKVFFPTLSAETPGPGPTEESSPVEPQGEWTKNRVQTGPTLGQGAMGLEQEGRGRGEIGQPPPSP